MAKLEDIPRIPSNLLFMNADFTSGVMKGQELVQTLRKMDMPLKGAFLDFGCGWGRTTYGLLLDDFDGHYLGIDIQEEHIAWLSENITPAFPNFEFQISNPKMTCTEKMEQTKSSILPPKPTEKSLRTYS